ncbi:MAG: hypothetical protein ACI9OU_002101 [Candidatus Promineifilaceae bacterium]|jgi:hypothetical protein
MSGNESGGMMWLTFALMTVLTWGLYGVCLHTGQVHMQDAENGRYKAFLFVGVAYVLIAVLAPLVMLLVRGSDMSFTRAGMTWSLAAGIVGAVGAFCVLLAFGANGKPAVVMSIIFAGAPVVNAVIAMSLHPPAGGLKSVPIPFFIGMVLAITGGLLVTLYKPAPGTKAPSPTPAISPHTPPNT